MEKKNSLYIVVLQSILLILLFFFIDQYTKNLFINTQGTIIQGLLNPHAAWGIVIPLQILIVLGICIIIFLSISYYKKYIPYWSFIFLLSGALGNLFDRIVFHGVRDRINIQIIPVFNIADILITLGVCIFIYHERFKKVGK